MLLCIKIKTCSWHARESITKSATVSTAKKHRMYGVFSKNPTIARCLTPLFYREDLSAFLYCVTVRTQRSTPAGSWLAHERPHFHTSMERGVLRSYS